MPRIFRSFLTFLLLIPAFLTPSVAMADDWNLSSDEGTNYVWIQITIGQTNDDGVFHRHELVATPSCRDQKRVEARGETVAPGVYIDGLKPKPAGASKIRTIDERDGKRQRVRCLDTFTIMINGEAVEMPASQIYATEVRFGIPKTETVVQIEMPEELKLHEHGIDAHGSIGPIEIPAVTATPTIIIPMDRFPEDPRVVGVKVVYTHKKAASAADAYHRHATTAADAAGDTRTPPGNTP